MQEIQNSEEVLLALRNGEILLTKSKNKVTFYAQKKEDSIIVRNENTNINVDLNLFKQLYLKQSFYVYEVESKDVFINEEKDEEYYRLWHK